MGLQHCTALANMLQMVKHPLPVRAGAIEPTKRISLCWPHCARLQRYSGGTANDCGLLGLGICRSLPFFHPMVYPCPMWWCLTSVAACGYACRCSMPGRAELHPCPVEGLHGPRSRELPLVGIRCGQRHLLPQGLQRHIRDQQCGTTHVLSRHLRLQPNWMHESDRGGQL